MIAKLEFLQISIYIATPKISTPNTINGIKMKIFVFKPIDEIKHGHIKSPQI
jgi:hypothetical protein